MTDPAHIFADISHHQAAVDLDAYAAGGHRIIVMKATESDTWTDATFADRWRRAGQLGLTRVAYAFLRTPVGGARQFDHLLAVVNAAGGLKPGDLLCQDVEDVGYGPDDPTRAARIARAAACSVEFTSRAVAAGFPVGWTYTGRWYAGPAGLTAALLPPGWRRLWISDTTPDVVELPAGWTRDQVVAVQYTDHADLPGIPGTDASILLGALEVDMLTLDEIVKAVHADVAAMLADPNHAYLPPLHNRVAALAAKVDALAVAMSTGVDPAVLAASLAPLLPSNEAADEATIEAALRNVLGSLNDTPKAV